MTAVPAADRLSETKLAFRYRLRKSLLIVPFMVSAHAMSMPLIMTRPPRSRNRPRSA